MMAFPVLPVGMLQADSTFCGHTMLQHGFDGDPLFVHHNMVKTRAQAVGISFAFKMIPLFVPKTRLT